jgi:C-terminal processing protease CtpA/Prc
LYPGTLTNDALPKIMEQVSKTKGLIIDFRCYPKDFTVFTLSAYLLPEEKAFVKFTNGSLNTPGLFSFVDGPKVGGANPNYYKGKVVIIINATTQSSAEYHTMAFRVAPRVTVIGSTTAAADGNVSRIHLPGNIMTSISGIGVYYPDGTETQRVGIVPDIEIKPTIKGIRAGRDELLEKAIEVINSEK